MTLVVPLGLEGRADGLMAVGEKPSRAAFSDEDLDFAMTLARQSAAALQTVRLHKVRLEKQRQDRELQIARGIQQGLLPKPSQPPAGFDVAARSESCFEVGGDYYDVVPLEGGRLAVVLGDVSGHGVPAALLMSHLRASFHAEASRSSAPSEIVAAMNLVLSHATRTGHFATFFLAIFEPDGGRFRCCNAGHNFPWLVHAGAARSLEANGIPIAMIDGFVWDESVGVMEPGDTLVIYSDGVPDWEHRREPFGDERWKAAVLAQAARGGSAREIAERLLADLEAFGRGVGSADDVTLVVVRALPR
jgi:sigma-B regulation protein RsbU (phosphoserine phosphatase)